MDIGSTMSSILVVIGDRLGLWKAMAAHGPITPSELAKRTETAERYIREWLDAQASAGYVSYDPATRRYALPPEQAVALADESSPAFMPGLFEVAAACWAATRQDHAPLPQRPRLGVGDQHPCLFQGTERFFRSGLHRQPGQRVDPALDGVDAKLRKGARVADVGCGVGASTILMAKAFPESRFFGFDSHAGSVELAQKRAQAAGVGDRVQFAVAKSTDFPGRDYDLIANFDCLHDMEDPKGAARHVRETIAKDGTWMIVEPFAAISPSRTTTLSVACSIRPRPCCAFRTRSRSAAPRSARRPAKRACAR